MRCYWNNDTCDECMANKLEAEKVAAKPTPEPDPFDIYAYAYHRMMTGTP